MSELCEHDWRVDPHMILMSNPPRQRLVCARCAAKSSRPFPGDSPATMRDPRDWERANRDRIEGAVTPRPTNLFSR